MKISQYLLAGLAIFGLAACSSDDDLTNGGQPESSLNTYLQLSFTNPDNSATRTDEAEKEEIEGDVKSVIVLLADQNGVIQFTATPGINQGTSTNLTDAFEAPVGTYYTYVIANPKEGINGYFTNSLGKNVQGVLKLAEKNTAKIYAGDNGEFTMLNQNNSVNPTGTDGKVSGKKVIILESNNKNNPAKVTVPVEKYVAKLRYNLSSKLDINKLKEITDSEGNQLFESVEIKGFIPLNGKRDANNFQAWTEKLGTWHIENEIGRILSTPQVQNPLNEASSYEYFYNPAIAFATAAEKNNHSEEDTPVILDKDYKMEKHVLENKPEFKNGISAKVGEATGVIFKAIFTLSHENLQNKNTFYYFDGKYYTNFDKLKEAVLAKDPSVIFDGIPAEGPTNTTTAEMLRATKVNGKDNVISVYLHGEVYYTYWIKDRNYSIKNLDNQRNNYHVVHRNTIYQLTINSITSVGPDEPGGEIPIDPETPIVDEAWLEVQVKVIPWIISDNQIDL